MLPTELTVGQVAARSGVAISTLHFYESKGLIRSRRNRGNQRRYARDVLRRIAFIRVSQRVGISLDDIRRALDELPDNRTPTEDDWAHLAKAWREDLNGRIEQLLRLRDNLTDCIGCGCLTIGACRLYNPFDKLASEGPGPRRLLAAASETHARTGKARPAMHERRARK